MVQIAFEKLIRKPEMIRHEATAKNTTLVFTIIKNQCMSYYRKEGKTILDDYEDYAHILSDSKLDLSEIVANHQLFMLAMKTILQLDEKYKSVMLLKYYYGLENQEISDLLDITINNVWIRLHRASKSVRKKIGASNHF